MTHTYPIQTTAHAELFDYDEPSDVAATPADEPTPASDRARGIAAIHAYAQWLADNPDVPMPTHVSGSSHPIGADYDERAALLRTFAAAYNGSKQRSERSAWSTVRIASTPIVLDHTVFALERPTANADWWL